jgi:hypothetical protein
LATWLEHFYGNGEPLVITDCVRCGTSYIRKTPLSFTCSKACANSISRQRSSQVHGKNRSLANRAYRSEVRDKVIQGYGSKCSCCGLSDPRFLTLDHVNNDGAAERRAIGNRNERSCSSYSVYSRALSEHFPPRFQLLCWNCNCAKHQHGGVCPHQLTKENPHAA